MELSPEQQNEIEAQRAETGTTRRATVPALEEVLYQPFPVLDHGFVRVIDYMGSDSAVVQAARVSYGTGTRQVSSDRGLIRYLMRHRHSTPFEMCEIKLHVKLPIFVARQWIRHRTANVNEYSARYSILDREFYVPDQEYVQALAAARKVEQVAAGQGQADLFGEHAGARAAAGPNVTAAQSVANKQGREAPLGEAEAQDALKKIRSQGNSAYRAYLELLNQDARGEPRDPGRAGLARELARMVLPTNYYTQWYWKVDLHNLLHFLSLRMDGHAQFEIRAYAEVIGGIAARWVPASWEAFRDYRQGAANLSAGALEVVRRMLAGEAVTRESSGLTAREWRELRAVLSLPPE